LKKYKIKIENGSGEVKEGEVNVRTSIEHIVSAFGNHGWLVTEYHPVFNDNSETKLAVPSI